jgi:hypothetical protein
VATKQRQSNPAVKQAGIKIRRAKSNDAARIAELSGQLGYPAKPSEIAQRLRRIKPASRHAVLVAESPERKVIGWLHVSLSPLTARRGEWLGSGRRRTKPRDWRFSTARCGTVGAQSGVQKHVRAIQCDPRTCPPVLLTPWLRTLQNTKSFSQAALNLSIVSRLKCTAIKLISSPQ